MADNLHEIDKTREAVTAALDVNNLPDVQSALSRMSAQLKPHYRSAQREVTRHNLIALNAMHPFIGRRKSRNELLENARLLNERDSNGDS